MFEEVERLRDDLDDAEGREGRSEHTPAKCGVTVLAKTKTVSSYPTVAARYYACETQEVVGTESEGGTATLVTLGDTFYALNLGSAVPPTTTYVICTFVAHRWVFRWDG